MQSNENDDFKDYKMDGDVEETTEAAASIAVQPANPKEVEDDNATTRKSIDLETAIMPPPPAQVLGPIVATEPPPRPPSSISSEKDEDEVLSLQVLSARSSTPYTLQAVCCNNDNCELGSTDSTAVSPVKEEPCQLASDEKNKEIMVDEKEVEQRLDEMIEIKRFSRSELMNIRDEMLTTVRPEYFESSRLKRLNFAKLDSNRNKQFRHAPNAPNDMMPAFYKRKTAISNGTNNANHMNYDTFKYSDSHPFNNHNNDGGNHRRIGSGRLSNRDINWDYIPEEDPDKNNLAEFFNTKPSVNQVKHQQRHSKKYESDDNTNYVKRVINSVVGESSHRSKTMHNSSVEERYSTNSSSTSTVNNKSEEPEWFSCGPTSRLDTIELFGFDESDQQQIRLELENAKKKPDTNNNHEEPIGNGAHKDKKHLAFQFDDFSTHSGGGGGGGSSSTHGGKANNSNGGNVGSSGSRMPSSKFMPLFNVKNREEEKNSTQNSSVNDFFKRSDMPPLSKEKLSLTEIPSVNEIEAKWRTQQNDPKSKPSLENHRNSSENFKKMLNQLNQQQNAGISASSTQQQSNQPSTNLFNNDNLSNLIKQRNLQQQLLRRQQQQQAAFAQLQLNAILGRPDTQMLLLSLIRGEISKHGLIVQLANSNLSQVDREAISAVLTFSGSGQYHNQVAFNSNQQHQQQLFANQLQNIALLQQINKNANVNKRNGGGGGGGGGGGSSANAGGFQANGSGNSSRTYSQEELQSHANYILQNAMIKKRLEEQTNLGVQKILQIQNSMMHGSNNYNNNMRGNDNHSGPKQHQPAQHYQHQQQPQQQHRQRKGPNAGGNRGNNPMGRRRSTSSSSSNATVNTAHMKLASDLEYRQIEQRRNTIATTTVGAGVLHSNRGWNRWWYLHLATTHNSLSSRKYYINNTNCNIPIRRTMSQEKMSFFKFLKEFRNSTPGMLAMAIGGTTVVLLTFRYLKPGMEARRRRQAETYANYLFEAEQQRLQQQSQQTIDEF